MTTLRLMTMNVASGCGMPYVDFTVAAHARFINLLKPDIVFLQEVDRGTRRASGVDQLALLRDSTGLLHSHFVKWRNLEGGEYGVAIISRLPLEAAENRSVWKPWHWWPYFVAQVITPVAYAQVDFSGTHLHLYATHFPSNNEDRKKFGADEIAAAIPVGLPMVLGGDFNDGPTGVAMRAIDARFITAQTIASQVIVEDQGEVCAGESAALDHLYLGGNLLCDFWTSVPAVEGPRGCFSDHAIVYGDLRLAAPPPPARELRTSLVPFPVPLDAAMTFTVSAVDAATDAAVAGEVFLNGHAVAATNTPFMAAVRQERRWEFDPELREWVMVPINPVMTVKAAGYPETPVNLGL
jgi:endonuclease/exonuclease/phosphatase family metal-dependent hydrolase